MSRLLIVANFKSNLNPAQAVRLVDQLTAQIWPEPGVEVVLAPTTLCLTAVNQGLDRRRLRLASQTGAAPDSGPYTGEVSFAQLAGLVDYSLIGHSERRQAGETDRQIADKVRAAIHHKISPIVCVGETKTERAAKETGQVLSDQVTTALANLTATEVGRAIIAYEPVWAISDGQTPADQTPTVADLTQVCQTLKTVINNWHGQQAAAGIRFLYGGSVSPDNAETFLATPSLDGLLIGAASLEPFALASIVKAANQARA